MTDFNEPDASVEVADHAAVWIADPEPTQPEPAVEDVPRGPEVVINRRSALMATIAIAATVLAALYLWRFAASGSLIACIIGVVLGLIAVVHGIAWTDARTPLLVADETGLRVKLGGAWKGFVWESIEYVEVEPRGMAHDGKVVVVPHEEISGEPMPDVMEGASPRTAYAGWLNRWLYDATLVVPFGLSTTLATPESADMVVALHTLAADRTTVVLAEDLVDLEADDSAVEVAAAGAFERTTDNGPRPADDLTDGVVVDDSIGADEEPPSAPKKRRLWPSRESLPSLPLVARTPTLGTPARRTEVTLPFRSEPAVDGALALSQSPESLETEPLPEIEQLRRTPEFEDEFAAPSGNVSLIIDATTDLSARAMQRVRRPLPSDVAGTTTTVDDAGRTPPAGSILGWQLAEARHNLRLSVDELAERTRIRPYVIESIEADDFSVCGGDFYARGHLRMLARVLGLDPVPLVSAYDEVFATSPVSARAVFDVEHSTGSTGFIRGGAQGANWGALIATVLALLLVWGVARYITTGSGPEPNSPAVTTDANGLGSPGAGNPPVTAPVVAGVKVAAVGGDSHVIIKDDFGKVLFDGKLKEGESQKVSGPAPLDVKAHHAGYVLMSVKGKIVGLVGGAGAGDDPEASGRYTLHAPR